MSTQELIAEKIIPLTPDFTDDRGEILNVISDMPFSHVAVITTRAGAVRGNHVHPGEQWMYLVSGSYVSVSGPDTEHLTEQKVKPGDLVYCPPNLMHAYRFMADSVFLNITNDNRQAGRYEEHTRPAVVIAQAPKATTAGVLGALTPARGYSWRGG